MTTLTPERIEEIRKRLEAIDGAPWKYCASIEDDFRAVYPDTGRSEFPIAKMPDYVKAEINEQNGEFIAHAPQDISDLLSAYDALSSRDAMREALVKAREALKASRVVAKGCMSNKWTTESARVTFKEWDAACQAVDNALAEIDAALSDAPRQKVEG